MNKLTHARRRSRSIDPWDAIAIEEIPPRINDNIDRRINDYAIRAFRDIADKDYIAGRMAAHAQLMPQFLWSSQQAIEKYLKCILLLNRIPARQVGHDIAAALELTRQLPFTLDIRERARKFIDHIATYGPDRYLETSPYLRGHVLLELDSAIWELRRYCQVLQCDEGGLLPIEVRMLKEAREALRTSRDGPPHKFNLRKSFLETVMNTPDHPARGALLKQNAYFGNRYRKSVKSRSMLEFVNSPLLLYPQMVDELNRYVRISREALEAYRDQALGAKGGD